MKLSDIEAYMNAELGEDVMKDGGRRRAYYSSRHMGASHYIAEFYNLCVELPRDKRGEDLGLHERYQISFDIYAAAQSGSSAEEALQKLCELLTVCGIVFRQGNGLRKKGTTLKITEEVTFDPPPEHL